MDDPSYDQINLQKFKDSFYRVRVGRSLFFIQDESVHPGTSEENWQILSTYARNKMIRSYIENPICSKCKAIETYLKWVDENREMVKSLQEENKYLEIDYNKNRIHFALIIFNLQRLKIQFTEKFDEYITDSCDCPIKKTTKDAYANFVLKIHELEEYFYIPFPLCNLLEDKINNDISGIIIDKLNKLYKEDIIKRCDYVVNFIYKHCANQELVNDIFNNNFDKNILLMYDEGYCETKGSLFQSYW